MSELPPCDSLDPELPSDEPDAVVVAAEPFAVALVWFSSICRAAAPSTPGKTVATTWSVPAVLVAVGLGPTENSVVKEVTLFEHVAVALMYLGSAVLVPT